MRFCVLPPKKKSAGERRKQGDKKKYRRLCKTLTQMAVSIRDAWDSITEDVVSAKKAVMSRPPSSYAQTEEEKDVEEEGGFVPRGPQELPSRQNEILLELQNIRREQGRRCTVYLAFAGVLFAIMFAYIDRLQSQVRRLNHVFGDRQMGQADTGPLILGRNQLRKQWYS